jgi:hypothetical protein
MEIASERSLNYFLYFGVARDSAKEKKTFASKVFRSEASPFQKL